MKLLSLNAWGGTMFKPLMGFIEMQGKEVDIFCFQETSVSERTQTQDEKHRHNLMRDLASVLPNHQSFYAPFQEGFNWQPVEKDIQLSNVIFVRKSIGVIEDGHTFVHGKKNGLHFPDALKNDWFTMPRLVQFVQLENAPTIFNFHGMWHTSGKGDMPARDAQSEKIVEFLTTFDGPKILCGDFNINIDAECLKKIETDVGMRNLIKDFKVETTRSHHYPRKSEMPFADYVLATPDIDVKSFSVPDEPVSDHLPMILEFN